jgi:hypothetical protein
MQILLPHGDRYRYAVGLSVALALSACTKPATEMAATPSPATATVPNETELELKWARLALARNPTLEVIASDPANGVITIRIKETGEVRAVRANDLAATPVASLTAAPKSGVEPAAPEPAATPASPAASAASTSPAPAAAASMTAAAQPITTSNYTIERADGQVKVSGPGVSIVSTGTAAVAATADDATQRGADPIICEGRRMLHFDNRNIYVEGDAIIARGGCELYITNSRVVADGTGVVVHDAIVHIANSTIEGGAASFDADDSAKMYLRGSTFQGLPRRSERALVQDQGGNQWR